MAAGPTRRDEVAQRLMAASPTAGPRLAESLLPAVRYATRRLPDAAIDVGQSKLGGAPDLPEGTAWPMWTTPEGERRPLQFYAQIDIAAAIASAPAPLALPPGGLLSFFADLDGGSTVIHTVTDAYLVRCSPRIRPVISGQLRPVGVWTWPSADGSSVRALEQTVEAELRAAVEEPWLIRARHQLMGHVPSVQPGPDDEDQWRVLFQLDSDESLEVTWGGGGSLRWSARAADIAAGVWNAGRFNLQSA